MINSKKASIITTEELYNFLECPRRMLLSPKTEEDNITKALRVAFKVFTLKRLGRSIIEASHIRKTFSVAYNVIEDGFVVNYVNHKRLSDEIQEERRKLSYSIMPVINNYVHVFGLYEDSIGGAPIATSVKFNIQCDCGNHYLKGVFDLVWQYNNNTYGIMYDFSKPKHFSYLNYSSKPSINLYILNKLYNSLDPSQAKIGIYFPWVSKLKIMEPHNIPIKNAGRLICIASECKSKELYWRTEDQRLCMTCPHRQKCIPSSKGPNITSNALELDK